MELFLVVTSRAEDFAVGLCRRPGFRLLISILSPLP